MIFFIILNKLLLIPKGVSSSNLIVSHIDVYNSLIIILNESIVGASSISAKYSKILRGNELKARSLIESELGYELTNLITTSIQI